MILIEWQTFWMKPYSSRIDPGESIKLPTYPTNVSAEGELAIIFGKTCRNIEESEVPNVVAGVTTSLDMTAKEIYVIANKETYIFLLEGRR